MFDIGVDYAQTQGVGTFYEPEGMDFIVHPVTGKVDIAVNIVMGDSGNRTNTLYIMGVDQYNFGNPLPDSLRFNVDGYAEFGQELSNTSLGSNGVPGVLISNNGSKGSLTIDRTDGGRVRLNLISRNLSKIGEPTSKSNFAAIDFYAQESDEDWEGNTAGTRHASIMVRNNKSDGVSTSLLFETHDGTRISTKWEMDDYGNLIPRSAGSIGSEQYPVDSIYLKEQPVVLSDLNSKTTVSDIDSKYLDIFKHLEFKQYTLDDDKVRFGVLAQDIIKACELEDLDYRSLNLLVESSDGVIMVRYQELQILFNQYVLKRLDPSYDQ